MSHIINQDYIGIIQRENNLLTYSEYPTDFDSRLAHRLESMVDSDYYTLLDLQSAFSSYCSVKNEYEYATSESYTDSFVEKIKFPSIIDEREYKNWRGNLCRKIRNQYRDLSDEEVKAQAEREMKEERCRLYLRYLYAAAFSNTLPRIHSDDTIRMYSTENIGWDHHFHLQLTDDIDILVSTNFCYGSSSFMNFALRYKGVLIVPYSDYVTYYYARVDSFLKCTRAYVPNRYNWVELLHFVVSLGNHALTDPDDFVSSWINDEVVKMVDGLSDIFNHPENYIKNLRPSVEQTIRIRRVDSGKGFTYSEINADERTLNFLAEKITGALEFIENLFAASMIQGNIKSAIMKVWDMNIALRPQIEQSLVRCQSEIDELIPIINDLEKSAKKLEKKKDKEEERFLYHLKWYERMVKFKKKEDKSTYELRREYEERNPQLVHANTAYTDAYLEYCKEFSKLNRKRAYLLDLQGFISRIANAHEIITKFSSNEYTSIHRDLDA